jgi:hypothetical protein
MKQTRIFLTLLLAGCSFIFSNCNFSPPPAPAGSSQVPQYLLKFVPYAREGAVFGYFTLANVETNQVAADGSLKLVVYSTVGVSVGEGSAMRMKNVLYEGTFPVASSNFQWESYGSVLNVQDLALKFKIPYENFKMAPRSNQVVTVEMDFRPTATTNIFVKSTRVILYP